MQAICDKIGRFTFFKEKQDVAKLIQIHVSAAGFLFHFVCHGDLLLRFPMEGLLAAEPAILVELQTIGIVLLVLEGIVIPLLALGAGQRDLNAHGISPSRRYSIKNKPPAGAPCIDYHRADRLSLKIF